MKQHLKRKIIILTPMVENLPGPTATKPGDIVKAMNGKSIKIDNTDAEGRLILADALCYADEFKPDCVLDMATLTGAVKIALGTVCSAVFTNDETMWRTLYQVRLLLVVCINGSIMRNVQASVISGDRLWRLPLWQFFSDKMTKCAYADLCNIAAPGTGGSSSLAAAFLKEFTQCKKWAHVDIAGVMEVDIDLWHRHCVVNSD